jgi:hypothetical protein
MQLIPLTLAPFLQEYEPQRDMHLLIERTLQYGNRAEVRWLFSIYTRAQIRTWVQHFGQERLPQPHRAFWQIILEIGLTQDKQDGQDIQDKIT